jgi:predicted alpha/beta-fold hydrolase
VIHQRALALKERYLAHVRGRPFVPAPWLRGGHAQTIWGPLFRKPHAPRLRREKLRARDGVQLTLKHLDGPHDAPRVLLLHGLEGSAASHYIAGMLRALARKKWRATVFEFRTCDGAMPRGRQLYHSGATDDLELVVADLLDRDQRAPLFVAGYSMGGNVLGKWLGEAHQNTGIQGAALVSAPYVLRECGPEIDRRLGGVYSRRFLRTLIPKAEIKSREYPDLLDFERIARANTIVEYDDAVTAPLHGFEDVWDYYDKSSCRQFLDRVHVPTLLLSSSDDPMVPAHTFPHEHAKHSPYLVPVCVAHGGHIGFVSGLVPWRAHYWGEERVMTWFSTVARSARAARE